MAMGVQNNASMRYFSIALMEVCAVQSAISD